MQLEREDQVLRRVLPLWWTGKEHYWQFERQCCLSSDCEADAMISTQLEPLAVHMHPGGKEMLRSADAQQGQSHVGVGDHRDTFSGLSCVVGRISLLKMGRRLVQAQ
jgi:hypothetical protein